MARRAALATMRNFSNETILKTQDSMAQSLVSTLDSTFVLCNLAGLYYLRPLGDIKGGQQSGHQADFMI
jgi:hypothetical protein